MTSIVTAQHKAAFDHFGFVVLRGLFAQDMGWITDEFEAAWRTRPDLVHSSAKNSSLPGLFVSRTERLTTLLDDPRMVALGDTLLGEGYSLSGGDGGYYNGDTSFHPDMPAAMWENAAIVKHMKIALYLEPLRTDTGALRVLPGSHLTGDAYGYWLQHLIVPGDPPQSQSEIGMTHAQLPAQVLETNPGDVIVFDHRLLHGSFGGWIGRRMFDLNLHGPVRTSRERAAALAYYRLLRDPPFNVNWTDYAGGFGAGWLESLPPARARHFGSFRELGAEAMREQHEGMAGQPQVLEQVPIS